MRPVRTPETNLVYSLPGGNEDNDLFCHRVEEGLVYSDWQLESNERVLIAAGARIRLTIETEPIPPVQLGVCWTACKACKVGMVLAGEARTGYAFVCPSCGKGAVKFRNGETIALPAELVRRLRELVAESIAILNDRPSSPQRDVALAEFTETFLALVAAT